MVYFKQLTQVDTHLGHHVFLLHYLWNQSKMMSAFTGHHRESNHFSFGNYWMTEIRWKSQTFHSVKTPNLLQPKEVVLHLLCAHLCCFALRIEELAGGEGYSNQMFSHWFSLTPRFSLTPIIKKNWLTHSSTLNKCSEHCCSSDVSSSVCLQC